MTFVFNGELAMQQFEKRRAANASVGKIDNEKLPAGSPMVYYCRHCGAHTETLPELHEKPPRVVCDACKALVAHGLVP